MDDVGGGGEGIQKNDLNIRGLKATSGKIGEVFEHLCKHDRHSWSNDMQMSSEDVTSTNLVGRMNATSPGNQHLIRFSFVPMICGVTITEVL